MVIELLRAAFGPLVTIKHLSLVLFSSANRLSARKKLKGAIVAFFSFDRPPVNVEQM
jgi:hypothetical protein